MSCPEALNLVFIGIHSERLVREASTRQDVSHHLRGGACSYINARIQNPSTVSKILLGNPEGSYRDFRCGGQDVEISYGAPTPQQRVRGLTCRTLRIPADNQSPVYLEDVVMNDLFIENQTEHYPVFRDCTIRGGVEHRGRSSRAVFINCHIADPQALRRTPGKNKVKSSLF